MLNGVDARLALVNLLVLILRLISVSEQRECPTRCSTLPVLDAINKATTSLSAPTHQFLVTTVASVGIVLDVVVNLFVAVVEVVEMVENIIYGSLMVMRILVMIQCMLPFHLPHRHLLLFLISPIPPLLVFPMTILSLLFINNVKISSGFLTMVVRLIVLLCHKCLHPYSHVST